MATGTLLIRIYSRKLFTLAVLLVFLTLGFCPLRNILCRLAQPEPARKTQLVPGYAKITSGKECAVFAAVAQHVAQPALSAGSGFDFTVSSRIAFGLVPEKAPVTYSSAVPLNLRNRV